MLNAGQDLASVLQSLEVSESTPDRWRKPLFLDRRGEEQKSEEAVRLKKLADENHRLKQLVADQALDIQAMTIVAEGNL